MTTKPATILLNQQACDWRSAIVDMRRATDKHFTEGWLPTVLDCITHDQDCGPAQIAMLLCVVRDRYSHIMGQDQNSPTMEFCSCGCPKPSNVGLCRSCAASHNGAVRHDRNRG